VEGITITTDAKTLLALGKLMRLISPALPVGAYSYSRGLEYAVHANWVHDPSTATKWIAGILERAISQGDGPIFLRQYMAWEKDDQESLHYWNDFSWASRESREIQEEERFMGQALARLLSSLDVGKATSWKTGDRVVYTTLFSLAAIEWGIDKESALLGYYWSWAESICSAAIRLIPLGQTDGQKILSEILEMLPPLVEKAKNIKDEEIGNIAPAMVIASILHEKQYTRLFRS